MWQRRNAESVRNFVIFLLILQNCGQARTQQEERRDGLAKLEFSGIGGRHKQREPNPVPVLDQKQESEPEPEQEQEQEQEALYVFNFAKIYETLYTRLLQAVASSNTSKSNSNINISNNNNNNNNNNSNVQNFKGRGLRPLHQPQLLWKPVQSVAPPVRQFVLITTKKPFHILEQLQQDLHEKLKRTTTVKPFSVLQQLDLEQQALALAKANSSFNVMQALQMEEKLRDRLTTTVKPFHMLAQLNHDQEQADKRTTTIKPFHPINALKQEAIQQHLAKLQKGEEMQAEEVEEEGFEILQPVASSEPQEQHKSEDVPKEQTRAKESQKRKRKRIRRRRKRIRRRRKRTRRRRRKKRKKKRNKRKKKKYKGQKDKKKRKKRKDKRKKKPMEVVAPVLGQPGQVIFANPTKQPHHYHYPHSHPYPNGQGYPYPMPMPMPMPMPTDMMITSTTKRPATTTTTLRPFNKIKYILRHNSIFKKKKKEYLSHVGHVLYPFIKFVAFFTVLNPFTLGVFLFTLVSPVVFGFLGFVALSVLVKPFLHLVFGVKRNVDYIHRKQWLANRQAEKLKLALRPVTIHKHYYQKPQHSSPPLKLRPVADWRRQIAKPGTGPLPGPGPGPLIRPRPPPLPPPFRLHHNPLLPDQRKVLEDDDFEDYDGHHGWQTKIL
uniref:GK20546 n=1 Tax=Drosophila willistoni TaxID=7260 RepID=B4N5C1_DROWI